MAATKVAPLTCSGKLSSVLRIACATREAAPVREFRPHRQLFASGSPHRGLPTRKRPTQLGQHRAQEVDNRVAVRDIGRSEIILGVVQGIAALVLGEGGRNFAGGLPQ